MKSLFSIIISFVVFLQPLVSQDIKGKKYADNYTIFQSPTRTLIPLDGDWKYLDEDQNEIAFKIPYRSAFPQSNLIFKTIKIPEIKGRSLEFVSFGINHSVSLLVNDQFIGSHQGGYLSFKMPVSQEFLNTKNQVKLSLLVDENLSIDNSLPLIPKPGEPSSYSGVTGSTWIQILPPVSVQNPDFKYSVDAVKNEVKLKPSFSINASDFVANEAGIESNWIANGVSVQITYTIIDPALPEVPIFTATQNELINSGKSVDVNFPELVGKPELWSPENPKIYKSVVSVKTNSVLIDEISFPVSFRTVKLKDGKLVLNSKEIQMKGFNIVEDYKINNAEYADQLMLKKLRLLKASGVNSIRFYGFPPTFSTLEICDSLGLFVFTEIPAFNMPIDIGESQNIKVHTENMLTDLTKRSRFNPSVIAIGIGGNYSKRNDETVANEYSEVIRKSSHDILTYFVTKDFSIGEKFSSFDLVGLDVSGLSLDEFKSAVDTVSEKGNFFIAGYGKEITPDNHGGYSDHRSQEFQAKYFMDRYKVIKQSGKLIGSFAGTFQDFESQTPRLISGNLDQHKITTGLLNDDLTERTAFEYLRKMFNNEITFNPAIGKYHAGVQVIFPVLGVIMIFIFMFFFSTNRRFRDNLTRSINRPFSFFSDIRDHRVILGLQTFGLVFLLTTSWALFSLSFSYGLRSSQTFDYLLSVFFPWVWVKETIIWWTWNPIWGILLLSLFLAVCLFLSVFFLVLLGWITKRKVTFSQSLISIIWSASPTLVIVLLAMIFEQVVISASWVVPYVVYFIIFLIFWTIFRVLKGLRIIMVSHPARVYVTGFLIVGIVLIAIYFHYEHYYRATDYFFNALTAFK